LPWGRPRTREGNERWLSAENSAAAKSRIPTSLRSRKRRAGTQLRGGHRGDRDIRICMPQSLSRKSKTKLPDTRQPPSLIVFGSNSCSARIASRASRFLSPRSIAPRIIMKCLTRHIHPIVPVLRGSYSIQIRDSRASGHSRSPGLIGPVEVAMPEI
jgi:hypothetical protein